VRPVRLAAALFAIVVGALVILLAADVRSWRTTFRQDALRSDASASAPVRLTAPTALPAGLSGDLLAVGRNRDWLQAAQTFELAYRTTARLRILDRQAYKRLKSGEAAVGKVVTDPDPVRAARAYDLLAALVFREALPGTGVVHGLVQNALSDLQNALRLDPGNEVVRENIELVLRYITVAIPPDERQSRGLGKQANLSPKGGYAGPPGAGY
jgi:hypothetical protein